MSKQGNSQFICRQKNTAALHNPFERVLEAPQMIRLPSPPSVYLSLLWYIYVTNSNQTKKPKLNNPSHKHTLTPSINFPTQYFHPANFCFLLDGEETSADFFCHLSKAIHLLTACGWWESWNWHVKSHVRITLPKSSRKRRKLELDHSGAF